MRVLKYIWRKLSQSQAIELAGPLERDFFESVYRLVFMTGLSTSDDYPLYIMYRSFIMIVCTLQVCLEIWHVFGNDLVLDDIISSANVIFIHFITIWKLMIMVSNKKVFKKLAKALESPSFDISTQRRKDIVNHWANTHKKYLICLLSIAHLTLFFWNILHQHGSIRLVYIAFVYWMRVLNPCFGLYYFVMFVNVESFFLHTFPLIDEVESNLMVDVKIPFDFAGRPLRYTLTYLGVGIMFHYTSLMVIMSEVIMQAYLIPLICQFDVLADCFENVFKECAVEFQALFPEINKYELVKNNMFVDKYLKRLGNLVTQHQAILDQTMELKTILSAPMLGQLACSGLLICFVGYQASATIAENLGKFAMSLLYLSYNMFTLYLICRWCEEITLQSQYIGRSAYFSSWESGISQAPGARACIILVIARSNKPLVFLAGGMYPLSLSSYTNLVKASYSALNILLTMSHE